LNFLCPFTYSDFVTAQQEFSQWNVMAAKTRLLSLTCIKDVTLQFLVRDIDGKERLKRDGTRAETRLGLSAQRTSPFKLAGVGVSSVDCWQPRCAHQRQ